MKKWVEFDKLPVVTQEDIIGEIEDRFDVYRPQDDLAGLVKPPMFLVQDMPIRKITGYNRKPSQTAVRKFVKMLEQGKLVVGPTETRYGLMARGDDDAALARLFAAKRRGADSPSALFFPDYASVAELAVTTSISDRLAEAFLPGPLTLVMEARRDLPELLLSSGQVGVRVSSSPLVAALLARVKFPVTATSANLSGKGDAVSVEEICRDLGDSVALILDAGRLTGPVSTVVDCSGSEPLVLREGAIENSLIYRAVSEVQ